MAASGGVSRPGDWRTLGLFWAVVLVGFASVGGVLQVLGPPGAPAAVKTASVSHAPTPAKPPENPDQITAPVAALLEPSKLFPPAMLPRIAADGRVSRKVYARPVDPADRRPRIAIVMNGFGMSETESRAAILALPGPVSLSFSPYSAHPDALLELSRRTGHETLVSLPLEPQGYPLNDAGSKSLLSGATPQQNAANLEWSLSRTEGYVGAIGAIDAMRGERFADISSSLRVVLDELQQRGLLYIDPRIGKSVDKLAEVPGRGIDAVIDDPQARADIEAKLAGLERTAREKGSAIGFAGPLRPVTVDRIAAWAKTLGDRGMALVPVSALLNEQAGK